MPKVSVIIPFNNVENYIEECLNSVLSQTLNDIEVILINDASTDRTLEIVEWYLQKDSRIKLININERKGQGFARNRGIEIATGEYIGFVDSDDFIESDMFECLYNSAKTNNTDISMCQVREYDDINENYITSDYYSLACLSSFQNDIFSAEDTKNNILDINVALWNKIYKREYLNNIGEKFPEGFIYEDLPFFFGTYLPAKRIQIVWKNLYSYRINRKNSTMQQFNNKILDRLPMVSLTYEKLKKVPYLSDLKQKIQAWIINDLFHRYSLLKENYHKEFFFQMKKIFQSLEIENIKDDYWKKVYHFQGYLLVMNNTFEDFNNKVFTEYLDIHKVEDRLRSEMIGIEEIDTRFNSVYQEITKNYKYTEDLFSEIKDKNSEFSNEIKKVSEDLELNKKELYSNIEKNNINIEQKTDSRISQVYEEITKNYKYTEELFSKLNEDDLRIYNKIEENKLSLLQNTDLKISQIYEEITKNYKYTEELVQRNLDKLDSKINLDLESNYNNINKRIEEKAKYLYNDIKDLSYVLQNNFEELGNEQNKISELSTKIVLEVENLKQENEVKISALRKEYKEIIFSKVQNISNNLEQFDTEIKNHIDIIQKQLETEKQQNIRNVEELKFKFNIILEEQQKQYKEEIENLKKQMQEMEIKLREEMKSPIQKLIEKYKTKSEK
ncbi:TPA: glycosyltransferase [Candidatus Avigastranaerophilus faecigallinarum]|nr:glycosyltransferase [Candidatus Avigastranaerophilus faecigallinarum]